MRAFASVTDVLEKVLRVLVMTLAGALVAVISYQVFGRYVLLRAPRWSEELARILMIWMTFLGAALLIRYKRSIQLEFFVHKVFTSPRAKAFIWTLNAVVMLSFALFMIYWGWQLIQFGIHTTTDSIRLPLYTVTISIPVGGLCMAVFLLEQIITEGPTMFGRSRGDS